MFKKYYRLAKPGIIYGNSLNVLAGFFLACGIARTFDAWRMIAVLVGSALVMASGCVVNNYIDRGIDRRMHRTKKRALVTGDVPVAAALAYAAALGLAGFATLTAWTNWLTVGVGVIGWVFYVGFYSWGKRASIHGTLIGSVSGAIPPVAGYTAVAGHLDGAALDLFLILVTWQMPHFYAIAMFRLQDYAAAKLPVWPVKKGMYSTKVQIAGYVAAFGIASLMLTAFGYTGYVYASGAIALSVAWYYKATQGFRTDDDVRWARNMFFFSLIVTLGIDFLLSVGALLP